MSYFYDQGSDIGVMVTLWSTSILETSKTTTTTPTAEFIPTFHFAMFLTVTLLYTDKKNFEPYSGDSFCHFHKKVVLRSRVCRTIFI